ncbi:MAG: hypothetical protein DRG63_10465, partial [Deltaproteobacteria bacterium]
AGALPDCATPRIFSILVYFPIQIQVYSSSPFATLRGARLAPGQGRQEIIGGSPAGRLEMTERSKTVLIFLSHTLQSRVRQG